MTKKILQYICTVLILSTIFMRCASIAPPEGGPRDSIAPRIIGINPPLNSINFKDKRITIDFDEYVQIKDPNKEVITSPMMDKKPTLLLKGRSIQVDIVDTLLPNTTYSIDFGNAIVDNNEGNKLGYFSYNFSTGSYIDSLIMSGLVVDLQKRDSLVGALVFFFDASTDSIPAYDSTLFTGRAEAIFRTDSSGLFFGNILKDKDYRVYAIIDENGNQKYEAGTDQVAMLEGSFNPAKMPDFNIWIDPPKNRRGARRNMDRPQLFFESFKEDIKRRQMLSKSERPARQKLLFTFSTPGAVINSVKINGIDSSWLMSEHNMKGDSVWYWIAPSDSLAVASLGDTLRGKIDYMRHDSLWQLVPYTEDFTLVHRIYKTVGRTLSQEQDSIKRAKMQAQRQRKFDKRLKKQLRKARKISLRRGDPPRPDSLLLLDSTLFLQVGAAEQARRDSIDRAKDEERLNRGKEKEVNPFSMKTIAANPLNPERHIGFTFDMPLREIDSTLVELVTLEKPKVAKAADGSANPDIERKVKFHFEIDSGKLNQSMRLVSKWEADKEYRLFMPPGVFTDIAFNSNDTLTSKFMIATPEKYGTVILTLNEDSTLTKGSYIIELTTPDGNTIDRRIGTRPGDKFTFRYLAPGKLNLRVTEDLNSNGRWDTGILVERRMPERIRVWRDPSGSADILAKENWDVEQSIDLQKLFESR